MVDTAAHIAERWAWGVGLLLQQNIFFNQSRKRHVTDAYISIREIGFRLEGRFRSGS